MPLIPRARSISESPTVSVKEDGEESSEEADKKSSQNTIQREKLGNVKENAKVEGCFSSWMAVQSWGAGLLWGPLLSCLTTVTVRGGLISTLQTTEIPISLPELKVWLVQLVPLEAHPQCIPLWRRRLVRQLGF